ncbi:MAG: thiamine phosphate synthase, partial [Rhodospirillaceae bacterium]|nr:thiamine phosphate synthase [Rhodospirillaceae bacterium]
MADDQSTALYLITPPRLEDPAAFAEALKAALDVGGAHCVQLRLKDVDDDSIRRVADILRPVTQDRDVAFVMNDRPDLARETGCDGVHVGQDDASYADARALLGPDVIIGVTCKESRHLAVEAAEAGADYVAFGAFFGSTTKTTTVQASPGSLAWWSHTTSGPSVAIVALTPAHDGALVTPGAQFA